MRLVPRRLRKTTFPSSTPYYGGRLTPDVIAGLGQQPGQQNIPAPPPPPPPAPSAEPTDAQRGLTALDQLRARGFLTDDEYAAIRQRIDIS